MMPREQNTETTAPDCYSFSSSLVEKLQRLGAIAFRCRAQTHSKQGGMIIRGDIIEEGGEARCNNNISNQIVTTEMLDELERINDNNTVFIITRISIEQ